MTPCPPDCKALAEACWLGNLQPHEARQFARHCATCPDCALEARRARESIMLIRAALGEKPHFLIYRCPPVIFDSANEE